MYKIRANLKMSAEETSRNIPTSVRRILRKEVNYGCPVKFCGSPFLSYHHFNPPWHIQKHHNPYGMIALCLHHHKAADNGAYTNEQLEEFKKKSFLSNDDIVAGEIALKRENILFDVGGNYYLGASEIHLRKDEKLIWLEFDQNGNIMINLDIKDKDGKIIFSMRENDWIISTSLKDIESPPAMKMIKFNDSEKDIRLSIEYKSYSLESFIREYQTIIDRERIFEIVQSFPKNDIVLCKVRGLLQYPFYTHFSDRKTIFKNLKGPFTINGIFKLSEDATMENFEIKDAFTIGNGIIIK